MSPCSGPWGRHQAPCPQGPVAQLRPEALLPAAFPHGHGERRADAYVVHTVQGVFAAHCGLQAPFAPCHLERSLSPPRGPLQPHWAATSPISHPKPKLSEAAGKKNSSGANGGASGCQAVGGTRAGDVPMAHDSALPAASPPTHPCRPSDCKHCAPQAPGNPVPRDMWGAQPGAGATTLSPPPGRRTSCAGPWSSGGDQSTERWPCCTSRPPVKAEALRPRAPGCHGSVRHPAMLAPSPGMHPPGPARVAGQGGVHRVPQAGLRGGRGAAGWSSALAGCSSPLGPGVTLAPERTWSPGRCSPVGEPGRCSPPG